MKQSRHYRKPFYMCKQFLRGSCLVMSIIIILKLLPIVPHAHALEVLSGTATQEIIEVPTENTIRALQSAHPAVKTEFWRPHTHMTLWDD